MNVQDAVEPPALPSPVDARQARAWSPASRPTRVALLESRGHTDRARVDMHGRSRRDPVRWRMARRARPTRAWKPPPKVTERNMNHALSTHLFVNHRLTTALLDRIQQAGIPAVEIFCARQHLDWRRQGAGGGTGALVPRLGAEAALAALAHVHRRDLGPLRSARGHHHHRAGEVASASRWWTKSSARSKIAEVIPFRYLIQHIGVGGEEFDERKFDAAFTALEELSIFARQRGVEILLENIPNALASAERLLHVRGTDAPRPELRASTPATPI